MSWVYILRLNNGKYYIGSTTNIIQRINNHRDGKSTYTSKFLPVKLVFKQRFRNYTLARKAEIWLKRQKSYDFLERIIKDGLIEKLNTY